MLRSQIHASEKKGAEKDPGQTFLLDAVMTSQKARLTSCLEINKCDFNTIPQGEPDCGCLM